MKRAEYWEKFHNDRAMKYEHDSIVSTMRRRGIVRYQIARSLFICARCGDTKDGRNAWGRRDYGRYVICQRCDQVFDRMWKNKPRNDAPKEDHITWMVLRDMERAVKNVEHVKYLWKERDVILSEEDRRDIAGGVERRKCIETLIDHAIFEPFDSRGWERLQAFERVYGGRITSFWVDLWVSRLHHRQRQRA